MGCGGSINYTMIHESSKWPAEHVGHDEKYWDELKRNLNNRFKRSDPMEIETPIVNAVDGGVELEHGSDEFGALFCKQCYEKVDNCN